MYMYYVTNAYIVGKGKDSVFQNYFELDPGLKPKLPILLPIRLKN